jgi:transketolase
MTVVSDQELVDRAVKTIQMLAVDAVEQAAAGHPGAPMGLADIAFELWMRELRFDPNDATWPDRDRFVLSAGHASMLLYALLHLSGYDLSLDEIKRFRQWGSKTPGHPEFGHTPGVETTTGPLGQGISNAVGMALALKMRAARFNPHEPGLVAARVFGIASDGDMMEGVQSEAASLAGHLGLDNLVFFYDDNRITIDGTTDLAFSEDVGARYEAYRWFVQRIDGHDHRAIQQALGQAVAEGERPSLIVARTNIARGAPKKQDTASAHGEPLGAAEVAATKKNLGWPAQPTFIVPDDVRALFTARAKEGAEAARAWRARLERLKGQGGEPWALWQALHERHAPRELLAELCRVAPEKANATRAQAGVVEQRAAALVPSLVGGSADLTPSNKTYITDAAAVRRGAYEGRNLHFGVREHAMAAVCNGMALAGDFIPFASTFLVFSDYMRPAIRLAAMSRLQVVYVFTHDSLYLGEDGPTHQPVEHVWALRAIPNLDVVRPADALECAVAWTHALTRRDGPTALVLTRQNVPNLARAAGFEPARALLGAYVIDEASGDPRAVLIATGSEVHVAIEAKKLLGSRALGLRVVSAPCWDAFTRQPASTREAVLGRGLPRATFELGITQPWQGVVGEGGLTIGHDTFGASARWEDIQRELGMTPAAIAERLAGWLPG